MYCMYHFISQYHKIVKKLIVGGVIGGKSIKQSQVGTVNPGGLSLPTGIGSIGG